MGLSLFKDLVQFTAIVWHNCRYKLPPPTSTRSTSPVSSARQECPNLGPRPSPREWDLRRERRCSRDRGLESWRKSCGGFGGVCRWRSSASAASHPIRTSGAAATELGSHGVACDCGEPWPAEARKLAETLADTFWQASDLHNDLVRKRAEIQRAKIELTAIADAVIAARSETSRAPSIVNPCFDAALYSESQWAEIAATAEVLRQQDRSLEQAARDEIASLNGRIGNLEAALSQAFAERDGLLTNNASMSFQKLQLLRKFSVNKVVALNRPLVTKSRVSTVKLEIGSCVVPGIRRARWTADEQCKHEFPDRRPPHGDHVRSSRVLEVRTRARRLESSNPLWTQRSRGCTMRSKPCASTSWRPGVAKGRSASQRRLQGDCHFEERDSWCKVRHCWSSGRAPAPHCKDRCGEQFGQSSPSRLGPNGVHRER